jgi:hypothetical protein
MGKQQTAPKPQVDPITDAEATLARLLAQHEQVAAERLRVENETGKHAYGAHAQGDLAAVAELDKIADIIMRHDQKLREIDLAIGEARARLQRAQEAEQQAQAREVARELLKRAARLAQLGQTLDDANRIRAEASCAIAEELSQLRELAHGLGVHVPSHEQFLALGSRAEQTATMQTPFARVVGEHLAPRERRTHMSYAQPWRDQIVKGCAALLGEGKREEAA